MTRRNALDRSGQDRSSQDRSGQDRSSLGWLGLSWIGLLALSASGCELDEVLDAGPLDAFVDAGPPADVGGRWTLSGTGRLTRCDDPRFETDNLRISSVLTVTQTDDTLALTAVPDNGGRFVFQDATVRESRVHFTTLEEVDGLQILLRFDGRYDALTNTIRGDFEGEGPAGCTSRGDFRVTR